MADTAERQERGDQEIEARPAGRAGFEPSQPAMAPVFPSRLEASEPVSPDRVVTLSEGPERLEDLLDESESPKVSFTVPRAVRPRPVPADATLEHPSLYFNSELSWLDFNWRVLHQAMDARTPLLERVRFLSITQSNLDEFYRKRVGGLKRQRSAGVTMLTPDGRSPVEQLDLIHEAVVVMQEEMSRTWRQLLSPLLRSEGIVIRRYEELEEDEQRRLYHYFMDHVYPVLTPLAVDPGHPFPFISNQSHSLAIVLDHPGRPGRQFARVKIPMERGRWIPLQEKNHFLPLEVLVAQHVDELFRGVRVEEVHAFRVTRNADVRRDEEEAEDLLQMISEELRERRFAEVVRIEVDESMPEEVVRLLADEMGVEDDDIFRISGPIDFTHYSELAGIDRPELKFAAWEPSHPPRLGPAHNTENGPSIFKILNEGDVLVHHPYDSFSASVQRFIAEAAEDPKVVAIKMTLYRTSENSPVIGALIRAAELGKQVAVLVEVTARFEEKKNIEWAQLLERAGVHVTYGLVGLKTHAKVTLIVRDEKEGIRTYAHIGTGNYHSATALVYTDLGLLTADPTIGMDLVQLFHHLTGHATEQEYRSLIIAPRDMRQFWEELIEREIEHQERGGSGRIIVKMNAIDDIRMIQALYRASTEGVQVDLVIRGHTRLRPGVPGISDNIRVSSIVGRFLEHDRIFCFENGGEREVYIGSADWRRRNLVERVEAVVRIEDEHHVDRLYRMLHASLNDNRLAWDLEPDGSYTLRHPFPGGAVRNYQRDLMREAARRRHLDG